MKKHPFKFNDKVDVNVGLIGSGISESRSPLMHMREATAQGIDLDYQLFDLDRAGGDTTVLPDILNDIQMAGYAGVNITHPCKQNVINYLDVLSPEAASLGAVNTVVFNDGNRYGHNTDWLGFCLGFKQALPDVRVDSVLQLGAGGAGSAVAYALAKSGAKHLYIFDIDEVKASELANRLADTFTDTRFSLTDSIESIIPGTDGIVNTTPVGMAGYPGMPIDAVLLSQRHWLADVIYFPLETALLRTARELGCRTMDGSGMAIHQAAEAFKLFTGTQADTERMTETFFKGF